MSDGFGVLVVVSIGIDDVVVSLPIPVVAVVSMPIPVDVSEPVDFSGEPQPIVAIATNAMKRMLFMRNTLLFKNSFVTECLKKTFHH